MSFAAYYSLFEIAPDKYSIHPYSQRQEILRFLKNREDLDIIIIGGGVLALSLAHQCVLNDLSVVLLEASDYGSGRSQVPIWSKKEWFSSAHIKHFPKVSGKISDTPHERFSAKVFMDPDSKIEEGFLHKSLDLVFDLLRAARSEGVFALNYLKVETTFRLGDRLTVKVFDGLSQERLDLKSRLVINATQYNKIGPLQKESLKPVTVFKETYPLPILDLVDEGISLIPNGSGEVFCISEMNIPESITKNFSLNEKIAELSLPLWGEKIDSSGILSGGILTLPQGGSIPAIVSASLETIGDALGKGKLSSFERPLPSMSPIFNERHKFFLSDDGIDEEFLKAYIEAEQIYSYEGFIKREPNASEKIRNSLKDLTPMSLR